jgi:hypothetical protein
VSAILLLVVNVGVESSDAGLPRRKNPAVQLTFSTGITCESKVRVFNFETLGKDLYGVPTKRRFSFFSILCIIVF